MTHVFVCFQVCDWLNWCQDEANLRVIIAVCERSRFLVNKCCHFSVMEMFICYFYVTRCVRMRALSLSLSLSFMHAFTLITWGKGKDTFIKSFMSWLWYTAIPILVAPTFTTCIFKVCKQVNLNVTNMSSWITICFMLPIAHVCWRNACDHASVSQFLQMIKDFKFQELATSGQNWWLTNSWSRGRISSNRWDGTLWCCVLVTIM